MNATNRSRPSTFNKFGFIHRKMLFYCLVFCQILVGSSSWVMAQGFLIQEDDPRYRLPRPFPRPGVPVEQNPYRIRELMVDASIQNQVATTQVTQVFENTSQRQIEAKFVFPLPYDGAVDKMTFMVDGKEYEAKLLPSDKARAIYEGYVKRNQDPALLEWIGTGMFQTSVFPIPAGATRTVTLRYSQLLKKDREMVDYWFPLSTAKYSSRAIEKFSLRIAIETEAELKNIYSPTHEVKIDRDDARHAVVRHDATSVIPNSDFRLVYDAAPGKVAASLLSYWPADEDQGYFMLLASPEIGKADDKPLSKNVIFVVDQSGSMSGKKIDQAREAAKFVLQNLREGDLFNVIRYEGNVTTMAPELQRFDETGRQTALGFVNSINAGGSTNIDEALSTALGMVQNGDTPSYIVFLTDGVPTAGETNELKIAKNAKTNNKFGARLISFGVGFDVNSRLLDRLTRENQGQTEYVRPDENIETAVAKLYQKISAPVLTKLHMAFQFETATATDGETTNRVYPAGVTDLFAGSQLVIIGRYSKSGPAKLKLSGSVGEREESFDFEFDFAQKGSGKDYSFVRQLWAIRRIGEIIDLIDLNGENRELIDELIALSTRHGIITPYTSYLADETQMRNQLSDTRGNRKLVTSDLASLGISDGDAGFAQRSVKQNFKNSDNLAQAESNRLPAAYGGTGPAGGGRGINPNAPAPRVGSAGLEENNRSQQTGMQKIGNVTIYRRGNLLVADNAVDVDVEKDKNIVKVKRFSDDYFKLIAENNSDENQIFSQQADEELLIVLRGKTYLIQ